MTASFDEQLTLLCELQDIDLNLHNIERELAALPQKIAVQQAAFDEIASKLTQLKTEREETERARRTDERELAASVEHLRERETKLYAIKTNKEYQAAIKEVSEGKKQNREREDRVLQAMERIEALGQEIAQLDQGYAEKEAALSEGLAAVAEEEKALAKSREEQSARRPKLLGGIEKVTLRKYEFIRRRYPNALVGIVGGVCQGCSRRIPPQLYNEILHREGFKACPSCQRLICVVEEPEEEKPEEGESR